jgi:hypothetical protein
MREWWVGLVLLGAGERSRAGALGGGRPWGAELWCGRSEDGGGG